MRYENDSASSSVPEDHLGGIAVVFSHSLPAFRSKMEGRLDCSWSALYHCAIRSFRPGNAGWSCFGAETIQLLDDTRLIALREAGVCELIGQCTVACSRSKRKYKVWGGQ